MATHGSPASSSVGSEAALPPEVLGHMFSSLSLPGLGRTRAVCSRWRDAGTLVASKIPTDFANSWTYVCGDRVHVGMRVCVRACACV